MTIFFPAWYCTQTGGCKKNRPSPKILFFRQISSLLLNHEFSLIYPRYRGKISRGIQIFYQNFCYSSPLVPILLLVFMRKRAKPPCVHANPNYHQYMPVPPEWAKIIDLMVFSAAKKSDSKIIFWKKSYVYSKIAIKSRFFRFFVIFE